MPLASSGDSTGYSIGPRASRGVDLERGHRDPLERVEHAPRRAPSRPRTGSAMNVANASFSQMPFHQRIVTRSPNHMCAISWAMVSATSSALVVGGLSRVEQQQRLAVGDEAEVLHRALREVRDRGLVELLRPGTGCRSSRRTSRARRRRPRARSRPDAAGPGRQHAHRDAVRRRRGSVTPSRPTTTHTR